MKSNQFKNNTPPLKVVRDNQEISDIIGRDATERLKRNVPKFDEDEKYLVKFHNPCIKFLHSLFKFNS